MKITSSEGEEAYLGTSDLVVFIDETGEEKFSDVNNPLFGLGGCAVMASSYNQEIRLPWTNLKEKHFKNSKILHAADLYQPNQRQILSLASFFKGKKFFRFASIITDNTELHTKFKPFQVVAISVCQRLIDLININKLKPNRLFILFEHSDRGNKLAKRYFDTITVKYENSVMLPMICGFVKKTEGESGIEVADFIVHTAGAQSRQGLKEYRKDFKSIFIEIDRKLMSFFLINQKVEFTSRGVKQSRN